MMALAMVGAVVLAGLAFVGLIGWVTLVSGGSASMGKWRR